MPKILTKDRIAVLKWLILRNGDGTIASMTLGEVTNALRKDFPQLPITTGKVKHYLNDGEFTYKRAVRTEATLPAEAGDEPLMTRNAAGTRVLGGALYKRLVAIEESYEPLLKRVTAIETSVGLLARKVMAIAKPTPGVSPDEVAKLAADLAKVKENVTALEEAYASADGPVAKAIKDEEAAEALLVNTTGDSEVRAWLQNDT